MDPACALTEFYHVHAAHSIADNARKTHGILTLCGHRFSFVYSLSQHHNARTGLRTLPSCYMVVSFLWLDATVSCELMNVSETTREVLCGLGFNLC